MLDNVFQSQLRMFVLKIVYNDQVNTSLGISRATKWFKMKKKNQFNGFRRMKILISNKQPELISYATCCLTTKSEMQ